MAAFEFKLRCLHTDNAIIPYINCEKPLGLDLREVYMKENENKQSIVISIDQKVCRLCMQLIEYEYIPLHNIEIENFQKFLLKMVSNDKIKLLLSLESYLLVEF